MVDNDRAVQDRSVTSHDIKSSRRNQSNTADQSRTYYANMHPQVRFARTSSNPTSAILRSPSTICWERKSQMSRIFKTRHKPIISPTASVESHLGRRGTRSSSDTYHHIVLKTFVRLENGHLTSCYCQQENYRGAASNVGVVSYVVCLLGTLASQAMKSFQYSKRAKRSND